MPIPTYGDISDFLINLEDIVPVSYEPNILLAKNRNFQIIHRSNISKLPNGRFKTIQNYLIDNTVENGYDYYYCIALKITLSFDAAITHEQKGELDAILTNRIMAFSNAFNMTEVKGCTGFSQGNLCAKLVFLSTDTISEY